MKNLLTSIIAVPLAFCGGSLLASMIVPAEIPAPPAGDVAGHDGSIGFRPMDGKPALQYPAPPQFGAHGTFSVWVNLDDPMSASGPLFSAGTPEDGWLLLQVSEGKLTLLIQRGVKPFGGDGECYINMSAPIDAWTPDSWHHVAAVWDYRGPAQSLVALFVDGEIVEERETATMAPDWGPEMLQIGSSSASVATPRVAGVLDGAAVFPFAVTPEQVKGLLSSEAPGAAIFVDFESGMDARDLRGGVEDAAARAESRAKWSSR
jgi:hypothetical protein